MTIPAGGMVAGARSGNDALKYGGAEQWFAHSLVTHTRRIIKTAGGALGKARDTGALCPSGPHRPGPGELGAMLVLASLLVAGCMRSESTQRAVLVDGARVSDGVVLDESDELDLDGIAAALDEIEGELVDYRSLQAFFGRALVAGARPVAAGARATYPCDGRIVSAGPIAGGRIEQVGSPLELYRTPSNLFVAGFIGSPRMNFINGAQAKEQGAATIGIRPEHITLSPDSGTWKGTVGIAEHLGSDTFLHIRTDSIGQLTARANGEVVLRHGDTIYLTPEASKIHRFSEEGKAL